mmetsp:Transcript_1925/g.2570  ORF Transcript_1925/g.2570 Transcript_1925/m.2570 type:complete len:129 (+) Transcript_1925:98-484(+)
MGWVAHARWARCRGAQVSAWSRQANFAAFDGPRKGLVTACAALRTAVAEPAPLSGFVEQGGSAYLVAAASQGSVTAGEDDNLELLSHILEDIVASFTTGQMVVSDLFGLPSGRLLDCPTSAIQATYMV